ncbi:WecB/TagA/CpsF family glycosyltransferase [bacterium]|nr:MAG: WecB/TagA/CpsF family glycosyltransferase [bacterium]
MTEKRRTLLSVPVDPLPPAEFLARLNTALLTPGIKTVFAINPEKIMRAQKDPQLLDALLSSEFLIPDGIGTAIGLRLFYGERVPRTTGISLMGSLLALAAAKGYGIFLFGARPQTNRLAAEKILDRHPALRLAGLQDGYLPAEDYPRLVAEINSSGADLLFVGLGSPLQEKWINRFRRDLKTKVCMGVGGSLDVIAGATPGAPRLIMRIGLEWIYRLIREPRRARRQLVLPKFIFTLLRKRFLAGGEK